MSADRLFFILGSIFGLLGVVLGAFAAHGLEGRLDAQQAAWWETAVRYQMYHALALFAVAWAATRWGGALTSGAGWFFVGGIAIFSGTLYLMALGAPRWFGAITPIGGTALIVGWLLLALAVIRSS